MNFIPLQKYLVIEKINEKEEFLKNQSQFEKARVVRVSKEISTIKEDDIIFIPCFAGDVYIEEENVYYLINVSEVIGKFKKE